jgi:CTP-dependent riboflavin kinase
LRIVGTVESRSSIEPGHGPPGETEIQRINPTRGATILEKTGWSSLAPGTLNLGIPNDVLQSLDTLKPIWVEDCANIKYPEPYQHIPAKRVAYYYYRGQAVKGNESQPIVARKAQVPVPGRVEILAPVKLRDLMRLDDGDQLAIELCESNNALD